MKKIWFFRLILLMGLMGLGSQVYAQDETCEDCHEEETAHWQASPHATGYHQEFFQTSLTNASNPNLCLACHTTGFSVRTQSFSHEAVTCEACHGDIPADHNDDNPELPLPTADVCGDCHVNTFQDWKNSLHGENDLSCQTCHDPHQQSLYLAETKTLLAADEAQLLCLDCHQETLDDNFAHAKHPEQNCADCHWHRSDQDFSQHILDGSLSPSGHDGLVLPRSCNDCHAEYDEDYQLILSEFEGDPLAAQVEILQLEAEAADVRAQEQNAEAVNLIQGLLLGLVVGGGIAVIWTQLRQR